MMKTTYLRRMLQMTQLNQQNLTNTPTRRKTIFPGRKMTLIKIRKNSTMTSTEVWLEAKTLKNSKEDMQVIFHIRKRRKTYSQAKHLSQFSEVQWRMTRPNFTWTKNIYQYKQLLMDMSELKKLSCLQAFGREETKYFLEEKLFWKALDYMTIQTSM